MKKLNKKGFTIVELVIVIAVIAILAAVLIPNFAKLVDKAQDSKTLQTAENSLKTMLLYQEDGALENGTVFQVGDQYFTYTDGNLSTPSDAPNDSNLKALTKTTDKLEYITGDLKTTYSFAKITELADGVTIYLKAADAAQISAVSVTTAETTPASGS